MTDALDDKQKEAIQNRIPLGRLGTVNDVASAAAYLISDESSYITGQVLASEWRNVHVTEAISKIAFFEKGNGGNRNGNGK